MSGVISLTLTPMMCGWMLAPHKEADRSGRISSLLEAGFERTRQWYASSLRWTLRHRLTMIAIMAGTMAATVYLYIVIPKGFFPQQDNGNIEATAEAGQDISYAAMTERVQELAKIVMADKDVQNVSYYVGGRGGALNTGRMRIELKPFRERTSTATEIIGRLRRAVQPVPGVALFGRCGRTSKSVHG
jgi:multidrug efflux pump